MIACGAFGHGPATPSGICDMPYPYCYFVGAVTVAFAGDGVLSARIFLPT